MDESSTVVYLCQPSPADAVATSDFLRADAHALTSLLTDKPSVSSTPARSTIAVVPEDVTPAMGPLLRRRRASPPPAEQDKAHPYYKQHLKLSLLCTCMLVGFYLWFTAAAMSEEVKDAMALDNVQLGVLFAVYAVPNFVMPVAVAAAASAPALLWRSVLLLMASVFLGAWLSYVSVETSTFPLLLLGRLLLGFAESFYASADRLLLRWFPPRRRGFAFGCLFASGEFGGAASFYLGGVLTGSASTGGYVVVFLVGAVFTTAALLCLCVAWWLDRASDRAVTKAASGGGGGGDPAAVAAGPSHVVGARGDLGMLRWVCRVLRRQTLQFWLSFFQMVCFYTGFYTFVSFTT